MIMENEKLLDDFSSGDLGLGDGLKPGSLPTLPSSENVSQENGCIEDQTFTDSLYSDSDTDSEEEFEISLRPILAVQQLKTDYGFTNSSSCRSYDVHARNESHSCDTDSCQKCEDQDEQSQKEFPVFADVPYGTSIRQQKQLFEQNIGELLKKRLVQAGENTSEKDGTRSWGEEKLTSEEIAMRLAATLQEVEDLKLQLETCEQRLDSKYKAIAILKQQADEAQLELKCHEKKSKESTMKLAQVFYGGGASSSGEGFVSQLLTKEIDLGLATVHEPLTRVNTEPKQEQGKSKVSRRKFNRMCQENQSLSAALQTKTEELRKLAAQKMALSRENDELMALLDVQERAKYEKSRSVSSEENYCTFSSTELAVLGACRCRVTEPDPCGCAHAAANMKREIIKMKEEILQYKKRRDEAFMTVDAYRKAFDEQLQKNKALTSRLATMAITSPPKSSRAKSAFRWLIGTLNDDEMEEQESSVSTVYVPNGVLSKGVLTQQEIVTCLVDMLQEKKEVLAHQRLAAQILGDRVKTLETKLSQHGQDEVFTHSQQTLSS